MPDIVIDMTDIFIKILCASFPAGIAFLSCSAYRRKAITAQGLYSAPQRECYLLIYVMTIASICVLKLCPMIYRDHSGGMWSNIHLLVRRPSWGYNVNLIPFGSFLDYYKWILRGQTRIEAVILNRLGNLIIFMLFGYLTSLLFRKASIKRTVIIGGIFAALCEIGQFFIVRYCTVDDFLINSIGVLLGYYSYVFVRNAFPGYTEKFLVKQGEKT